jgi:hypothetical protein
VSFPLKGFEELVSNSQPDGTLERNAIEDRQFHAGVQQRLTAIGHDPGPEEGVISAISAGK